MIISRNTYEKLVAHNKKPNKRDNQMCELFVDRETKSPIVEQRDAEIEALKHMIERLEAEQEKIRKENIKLKEVIDGSNDTGTSELLKHYDKLVEDLSKCQRKLNYLRDIFRANLESAVDCGDVVKARMWQTFLMEVE